MKSQNNKINKKTKEKIVFLAKTICYGDFFDFLSDKAIDKLIKKISKQIEDMIIYNELNIDQFEYDSSIEGNRNERKLKHLELENLTRGRNVQRRANARSRGTEGIS